MVLNLPVGALQLQAVSLKTADFKKQFLQLLSKNFNGYIVVTIEGYAGIEEGVFLFRNSLLFGALYEYTNFDIVLFGDLALQQAFNAAAAENAVMDVCELSKQQVELIVAFNDKIQLQHPLAQKDAAKFFTQKYDSAFAEKTLQEIVKREESKYDVFKKIGLTDISK